MRKILVALVLSVAVLALGKAALAGENSDPACISNGAAGNCVQPGASVTIDQPETYAVDPVYHGSFFDLHMDNQGQ